MQKPPIDTALNVSFQGKKYQSWGYTYGSEYRYAFKSSSLVMPHQICIDERHSPRTVQNQEPQHSSSAPTDGPGESFHRYLMKEAAKVQRGETQREDAHEVLIFVCLLTFSLNQRVDKTT